MSRDELADIYRAYIASLNRQDWPALARFVHEDVIHNAGRSACPAIARCWSRTFAKSRTCVLRSSC